MVQFSPITKTNWCFGLIIKNKGCAWVGLRGLFDLTHHGGSKKIQPNPTHHIHPTQPTWVRLDRVEPMGLAIYYNNYY